MFQPQFDLTAVFQQQQFQPQAVMNSQQYSRVGFAPNNQQGLPIQNFGPMQSGHGLSPPEPMGFAQRERDVVETLLNFSRSNGTTSMAHPHIGGY